jgi:patatin-like phospholipase/acyl hydrolase
MNPFKDLFGLREERKFMERKEGRGFGLGRSFNQGWIYSLASPGT